MNYLFFDILITGHHTEYIGHLINYLKHHNSRPGLNVIVVHPHFTAKFPRLAAEARQIPGVQLVEISEAEFERANTGSLIRMSFSWFRLVKKYAHLYRTTLVFLLYFNIFQVSLIFFRPNFKIRGILFLQFYRMTRSNWKERLKYLRKQLLTKLYTANSRIERIFILNDPGSTAYLNRRFRSDLFHVLKDPVPLLHPLDGFSSHDHYRISPERKILLHLGALSDRKGTLEFIQSALFIKPGFQQELALLVAGTADSETAKKIEAQVNHVTNTTAIQVVYDKGFLSDEKMKSILNQCFAVVIPYKNPEASSGILGHAAASNKPVITTGQGLLKELIQQYRLGLLVDEVDPQQIASKIEELLCFGTPQSESETFITERTPMIFASTLLE